MEILQAVIAHFDWWRICGGSSYALFFHGASDTDIPHFLHFITIFLSAVVVRFSRTSPHLASLYFFLSSTDRRSENCLATRAKGLLVVSQQGRCFNYYFCWMHIVEIVSPTRVVTSADVTETGPANTAIGEPANTQRSAFQTTPIHLFGAAWHLEWSSSVSCFLHSALFSPTTFKRKKESKHFFGQHERHSLVLK